MATAEERLAKIKEKQAQLKAQEKKIITQEKAKERKLRTKRLIEIGGTAVPPAAKVVTGKVLDAADASGSNHSLSQHAAAGMSYIDTQAGEEGIDFLADFEKADSTEKPDKHIAGNGFFS